MPLTSDVMESAKRVSKCVATTVVDHPYPPSWRDENCRYRLWRNIEPVSCECTQCARKLCSRSATWTVSDGNIIVTLFLPTSVTEKPNHAPFIPLSQHRQRVHSTKALPLPMMSYDVGKKAERGGGQTAVSCYLCHDSFRVEYYGRKPPFCPQLIFMEDVYCIRDPFSSGGAEGKDVRLSLAQH